VNVLALAEVVIASVPDFALTQHFIKLMQKNVHELYLAIFSIRDVQESAAVLWQVGKLFYPFICYEKSAC